MKWPGVLTTNVFTWLLIIGLMGCQQDRQELTSEPTSIKMANTPAVLENTPAGITATTTEQQASLTRTNLPALTLTMAAATTAENSVTTTPPKSPTATTEGLSLELSTPIRFAIIGDFGLEGAFIEFVADHVKSWQPDFIITTGDNNYPKGAADTIDDNIGQYYAEFIHPYLGEYGPGADTNRFFPTPGNHDWYTEWLKPYLDYFTLPGNVRYYDFVWGPVHFFGIDSDPNEPDGVSIDSIQAKWLRERLSASQSPWKLVYMHHPPYSSASHGSVDWMQWPYKEWGATAVISGHDHVYERLTIDDFLYIINGLGGTTRYDFPNPLPGSQVRYQTEQGAMLVDADASTITFQFINRFGEVIDSYSLTNNE